MESEIWGIKVCHGEKSKIPIKDNMYTLLKNVSLGEITSNEPTFVRANIETIQLEKYNEATNEAPTVTNKVILAVLTPNKIEQVALSEHYSPLDNVTVEAAGPNDVYLAGNYNDLSDYDEEEEEEEEFGEDMEAYDENQVTKSLMDVINKSENEKKEE